MKTQSIVCGALAAAGLWVTSASAAPVQYAGNQHYYEFIGDNLTWDAALAAAATATPLAGYDSYLVTITDAGEDAFVKALAAPASFVWAAGTDQALEGTWRWAAGPETGDIFYILGGPTVGYSHWNAGEPNNIASENVLHIRANTGDWNDIFPTFPSGGYVVEYSLSAVSGGAVPEPATWGLMIAGFGLAGASLRRRRVTA